jgi:hypothetical protein
MVEIRSYADLVHALRARKEQLNVSYEVIEAISGLQSGYISKLLSPRPSKRLGQLSLGLILQTLGLKLVLVEDKEAMARVRSRLTPRYRAGSPRHAVLHVRQPRPAAPETSGARVNGHAA